MASPVPRSDYSAGSRLTAVRPPVGPAAAQCRISGCGWPGAPSRHRSRALRVSGGPVPWAAGALGASTRSARATGPPARPPRSAAALHPTASASITPCMSASMRMHECAPLRRMRRAVLRQSPKVGVRREATTLASAVRCESSTQCSCSAPPVERPLRTSTCCSCCLSSARSLSRSLSLSERALHSGAL